MPQRQHSVLYDGDDIHLKKDTAKKRGMQG